MISGISILTRYDDFDDIVRFLTVRLLCDVPVDHKRLAFYCFLDTGNGF